MKSLFQSICSFMITVGFNVLCILVWIVNGLQALYNFVVGVIQLPHQLLKALSVMMCICGGLGFFIAGKGSIGNVVLNLIAMVLIMSVTYKLAEFIPNLLLILAVTILKLLDPSTVLAGLVGFADKLQSQINYQAPCANYYSTYFVARILTKLDWLLQKVFRGIAYTLYPISIGGGLYALWCSVSEEFSVEATIWGATEYVCAAVLITCTVVISSMVAHNLHGSITEACDIASAIDTIFEDFINKGCRYKTSFQSEQQYYREYDSAYQYERAQTEIPTPKAENKYDVFFEKCTNADEIRKVYYRLTKDIHPDVNTKLSYEEANQEMSQLNAAAESARARFAAQAKV